MCKATGFDCSVPRRGNRRVAQRVSALHASQSHETKALALDPARQIELQKRDMDALHGEAGRARDLVDRYGSGPERRQNGCHFVEAIGALPEAGRRRKRMWFGLN